MENETKKPTVIAKTQTFFKIGTPIIFGVLAAFIVFFMIIEPFFVFAGIPILVILATMLVLCLSNPVNAIVYDEEKQEFIIRAAQTYITNYKRRYVKLSEIEKVVGYPMNIWFPSSREGLFIFIKNNPKPLSIRTINRPELAAEKINVILMQSIVMQEIAKKNQTTEN